MKVFKSIIRKGRNLYFTTADYEVEETERKKKVGSEGCIWYPRLQAYFMREGEWIHSRNKVVRVGVAAAVFDPRSKSVLLNRFDSGHPTAAGKLTPPAGIWLGKSRFKRAALQELGEEVILTSEGFCGMWSYQNHQLESVWVERYAEEHGLERLPDMGWEVVDLENDYTDVFNIFLDGDRQGKALATAEFETGSIELIFLFELNSAREVNDFDLKDGESFKNQWLNREVGWFTKEMMKGENLTSKAEEVLKIL